MVLKILLIVSVVLQLAATVIAIRLTRMTRFNFSWILFTVAFVAMTLSRCFEYAEVAWGKYFNLPKDFLVWLGVAASLCFTVGLFYVKKIFNYIEKINVQRRLTERRILNTILRTEEKERLRFSKELHDGLGPLLSSAKMSISVLKGENITAEEKEILDNTNYVIEEAIKSLREISNNLSPHILNDFGLSRGINNFINKLPSKGNLNIDFKTNLRSERFDTDIEVILYRVMCELINNSIKHSGGTQAELSLTKEGDVLNLVYSDNGRGFNPSAMMDVGMGLSNIASRIASIKGNVDITGSKGNGMKAVVTVNLKQEDGKGKI